MRHVEDKQKTEQPCRFIRIQVQGPLIQEKKCTIYEENKIIEQ